MRLYKKNKGSVLIEFVLVLPFFLLVIAAVNDIANYTRLVSNMDELASSVVNVPFYLNKSATEITDDGMRDAIKIASKAYVVSYKLYVDSYNTPKMAFCWTAMNKKGVLWRIWLKDIDGSLTFSQRSSGSATFENFVSQASARQYSAMVGNSGGKILILEVFLDIKNNNQFINLFNMVRKNFLSAQAFSTAQKFNQIPDNISL